MPALQLDARLNQDPTAGRAQLLRWLKDGKLRVVLGPDGKPYAKGELIPFTVLAEAENTKPTKQLGGSGGSRYMSFVAWAGFASISTRFQTIILPGRVL